MAIRTSEGDGEDGSRMKNPEVVLMFLAMATLRIWCLFLSMFIVCQISPKPPESHLSL
jgi:hypothetical protein